MNRWILRTVSGASLAGALALVPAGIAWAQSSSASQHGEGHHKREGGRNELLKEARRLDSLSSEQRTAIEQLAREHETAAVPVRQANAHVLLQLAQQVEQATIDTQALAPSLGAEETAAAALNTVDRDALTRLHALLTPAQRGQLVDRLRAGHEGLKEAAEGHEHDGQGRRNERGWAGRLGLTPEQKAQVSANLRGALEDKKPESHEGAHERALESFRGDSFDASAFRHVERRGEREETFAKAIVPVLTPAQRAVFANRLRAHAARESS